MTIRHSYVWFVTAVFLALSAQAATGQPQLFWSDTSTLTVESAKADRTDRTILSLFVDRADQVAIDRQAGRIYWTDLSFSSDNAETARRLRRANLDGTEAETLVLSLEEHYGLVVDSDGGRVYWSEPDEHRIRSANLDGTDVQVFLGEDEGVEFPGALAFDAADHRLFWIDSDAEMIRSARPDGTELTDVAESAGLFGLALDPANQMVYWSVYRDNEIRRARYDGSGEEVAIETVERPRALAVNAANERIYWSSASFLTHALHGSDLNGSDRVDYLEAEEIRDVTVNAETNNVIWTGDGEASESGIGIVRPISEETDVLFPGGNLRDVEADASAGYVFWSQGVELIRMRFDGSEQTVLHDVVFAPQGIDLDRAAQMVYFASGGHIHRMDYDGGSIEQITDQGTAGLGDVAVDPNNGSVYWAGNASSTIGFIERSNLDGSNRQEILTGLNYPRGIRANPETGMIYWAYGGVFEGDVAGIRSAGSDGTGQADVITTLTTPRDLAIDGSDEMLYWTDSGTNRIERSNLDGSGVETVVSARLETPDGLSVVPSVSTARGDDDALPAGVRLDEAYPNPFNPKTTIGFEVPREMQVHLAVYDLLGRRVRILVDGRRPAGSHSVSFRANGLSSGIYIYRLNTSGKVQTRTLTLAKIGRLTRAHFDSQ